MYEMILNIATEFGYPTGNSFGAYRISPETYGGKTFSQLDAGIPNSGEIQFGDFGGKRLNVVVDCYADCCCWRWYSSGFGGRVRILGCLVFGPFFAVSYSLQINSTRALLYILLHSEQIASILILKKIIAFSF